MKRALIIGGGIAGPVTAMALQRAGIEATVFEAHRAPAEHLGLFLGLSANGLRVLQGLGILDAVVAAGAVPTPTLEFRSTTGRRIGTVPAGSLDATTPSITLMRGALQTALDRAATVQGIDIRYGRRFGGCRVDGDGVTAWFEDGSEAEADLLIGADGIHSRVRSVMDPAAPRPRFSGLLNVGGVVPSSGLPPTPGTMRMVWGRKAFFGYTVQSHGEAWWFANVGSAHEPASGELAETPSAEWQRRLLQLFAADPAFIGRLISRTDEIGATPIHDMPALPRWHGRRIVLVGDAAHAVSPSAGQGASLALEDAVVLGKCLRDVRPLDAALRRYEEIRRPRAERVVATGRRRGAYKAPRNAAMLWLRDLLLPVAFRLFATEKSMAWLYDYEVSWDEPAVENAA